MLTINRAFVLFKLMDEVHVSKSLNSDNKFRLKRWISYSDFINILSIADRWQNKKDEPS